MFAAIFTFALLAGYVASEIPSFINVCGRKNPNLDQCILNNVNIVKPMICKGIPELGIPSNDPFVLDILTISNTTETKLLMRDIKVTGLCDFTVNSFHFDIDKLHFDAKISFALIKVNSTLDIDVRILVPIVQKVPTYITTDSVTADVAVDLKVTAKSDKRYVYMSQIKVNLDIKDYEVKYDLNDSEFEQLYQVVNNFIGTNKKEIIATFKPMIEEIISKRILSMSNVKHFTYEELFPDRT